MTAPDRIYTNKHIYTQDRISVWQTEYIRADKAKAALFQLKSIQAYLDVMHKDNVFLRSKVQAAINQLEL